MPCLRHKLLSFPAPFFTFIPAPTTVETIFDHRINPQELHALFGVTCPHAQEYLQTTGQCKALADLYRLYNLRGQRREALEYLNRLEEAEYIKQ